MTWQDVMQALQWSLVANFAAMAIIWNRSLLQWPQTIAWLLKHQPENVGPLVADIVQLARLFPSRSPHMHSVVHQSQNPFLFEAFSLLTEGILDEKSVSKTLQARIQSWQSKKQKQIDLLHAMARVPAALGLLATLWFASKSEMPVAYAFLAVNVAFSYFLYLPLADWIETKTKQEHQMQQLIAEGIQMIHSRTNPVVVAEMLNSYLPNDQRGRWTAMALPTSGKKAA